MVDSAQADAGHGVDTDTLLVPATGVTQQTNGKPQVEPKLDAVAALPEVLGKVESAAMDNPKNDS